MNFILRMKKCKTFDKFQKLSIQYIVKLNKLNSKCDYELIENDQRELIIPMIFNLAKEQNIDADEEEDFTIEYREW